MASEKGKVYECRAKGIFRKEKLKPLVGDYVEVEILDPEEKTGNVVKILPRKNQLIRPAVANVDQALVIFAVKEPNPNFMLLDRFLIVMERQDIPAVICFNKEDLGQEEEKELFLLLVPTLSCSLLLWKRINHTQRVMLIILMKLAVHYFGQDS